MEFNELISDFADRHNIEGLAVEDDSAALDVDGIVATIVCTDGVVMLSAEIGEPPLDGRAEFADLLLEANLESAMFFAKLRETGNYVILKRIALSGLDGEAFDSELEGFVNAAETWKRLLADYRPVAKHAAEESANKPPLGADGFMQV